MNNITETENVCGLKKTDFQTTIVVSRPISIF